MKYLIATEIEVPDGSEIDNVDGVRRAANSIAETWASVGEVTAIRVTRISGPVET